MLWEHRMVFARFYRLLPAVLLVLAPGLTLAQPVSIGRSSLSLPEPQRWESRKITRPGLPYSGDGAGELALDTTRLVLTTPSGAIKAIVIAKATKAGVAGMQMSWGNPCATIPQSDYLYKRDRSNNTDVDCLVVIGAANVREFVDGSPSLRQDLDGKITEGGGAYFVFFANSLGSGGYLMAQMLISQDFKGLAGGTADHQTKLSTPVIAWSVALANSSKGALGSFSGNWAVPAMQFSE